MAVSAVDLTASPWGAADWPVAMTMLRVLVAGTVPATRHRAASTRQGKPENTGR